jgi:asparagine synthase (glutamine-hydrolysing)
LLAGYGKYPRSLLNWRAGAVYAKSVPRAVRDRVALSAARVPGQLGRYIRRSFLGVAHAPELTFFDTFAGVNLARQAELLSPGVAQGAAVERAYGASMAHFLAPDGRTSLLDRMLYADMKTYLVELLMKQDQMSMAASIESRVPFLDDQIVEHVSALPAAFKLRGWTTKAVLREAVREFVPQEILHRRKMGFPVPFGRWLRGPFRWVVEEFVLSDRALARSWLSPDVVRKLVDEHWSARAEHGDRLWLLVNLEMWQRTFVDAASPSSGPPSAASGVALSDLRGAVQELTSVV